MPSGGSGKARRHRVAVIPRSIYREVKKEQEADNDAERSMNKEKQNAGS